MRKFNVSIIIFSYLLISKKRIGFDYLPCVVDSIFDDEFENDKQREANLIKQFKKTKKYLGLNIIESLTTHLEFIKVYSFSDPKKAIDFAEIAWQELKGKKSKNFNNLYSHVDYLEKNYI